MSKFRERKRQQAADALAVARDELAKLEAMLADMEKPYAKFGAALAARRENARMADETFQDREAAQALRDEAREKTQQFNALRQDVEKLRHERDAVKRKIAMHERQLETGTLLPPLRDDR